MKFNYIELFFNASLIVQIIIVILIFSSIYSWSVIFEKFFTVSREFKLLKKFEIFYVRTRSSDEMTLKNLFSQSEIYGNLAVYKSFRASRDFILENEKNDVNARELEKIMEQNFNLKFYTFENKMDTLGSIGSLSPYLSLIGTIFGIITTFGAIGSAGSVNIAIVAPGISEVLLTTAAGLFVAIPAVFYCNKFTKQIDYIHNFACDFFDDISVMMSNRLSSTSNIAQNTSNIGQNFDARVMKKVM